MNKNIEISPEQSSKIEEYWTQARDIQLDAARQMVPLFRAGNIFQYDVILRGDPPLYILQRGMSVESSGTAEMLEYGAAQFEGEKFIPFDELPVAAVALRKHLVFSTGHIAPYQRDHLRVKQVSGYVDFENPCVEVTGDVGSYTSVFRLETEPVLLG